MYKALTTELITFEGVFRAIASVEHKREEFIFDEHEGGSNIPTVAYIPPDQKLQPIAVRVNPRFNLKKAAAKK